MVIVLSGDNMATIDRAANLRLYSLIVALAMCFPRAHTGKFPDVKVFYGTARIYGDNMVTIDRTAILRLYSLIVALALCFPRAHTGKFPDVKVFYGTARIYDICNAPEIKALTELGERGLTGETGRDRLKKAREEPCELVRCVGGNVTVITCSDPEAQLSARSGADDPFPMCCPQNQLSSEEEED
ncbi:hypothetical protein HPB50_019247 [Hyalomma asiaticum]|uniref:Uncharacterized protein n=1 Tax=Hyalomma asiaticum TaxID=266040 RepID=A0ACB7T5I6_HYAAI|nr:hypothetical protein HPB50_019247 [Hyalomma asiaticum]